MKKTLKKLMVFSMTGAMMLAPMSGNGSRPDNYISC